VLGSRQLGGGAQWSRGEEGKVLELSRPGLIETMTRKAEDGRCCRQTTAQREQGFAAEMAGEE